MAIKDNSVDTIINEAMDNPVVKSAPAEYTPSFNIPFETAISEAPRMSNTDFIETVAKAFSPSQENLLYKDIYEVANDFMLSRYGADYLKNTNMQNDFNKYRGEIAADYVLKKQQQNKNQNIIKSGETSPIDIAKETITGTAKTAYKPIDWLLDPERAPEDIIEFFQTMGSGIIGGFLALPSVASNTVADIAYNIGSGFEPDYDKRVVERMKEDEGDWMDKFVEMIDPIVPGDVRSVNRALRGQNIPGIVAVMAKGFKDEYKLDRVLQASEAYIRGDFKSGNRFMSDFFDNIAEKTYQNPLKVAADLVPTYKLATAFARGGLIDNIAFNKLKLTPVDEMKGIAGEAVRFLDNPLQLAYFKTGLKILSTTGKNVFDFAKDYNAGTGKAIRLKKAMDIGSAPLDIAMKTIEYMGKGVNFARNKIDFYKKISQQYSHELYMVAKAIQYGFAQKRSIADDFDGYLQIVEDSPATKEWLLKNLDNTIISKQNEIQKIFEAGEEDIKVEKIKSLQETIDTLNDRKTRWAEGNFYNSDFTALHSNMMTLVNRLNRYERLKAQLSTETIHNLPETYLDELDKQASELDYDYAKFADESRNISEKIRQLDIETKPYREAYKKFTELRKAYNDQITALNKQRMLEDANTKATIDNYEQLKKELTDNYKKERAKVTEEFSTSIKNLSKKTKSKKLSEEDLKIQKETLTKEYKAKISALDETHKNNLADYDAVTQSAKNALNETMEARNIEDAQLYNYMTEDFLKENPTFEAIIDMAKELKREYKNSATIYNNFETAINVAKAEVSVANDAYKKAAKRVKDIEGTGAGIKQNPAYQEALAEESVLKKNLAEKKNEYAHLESLYDLQQLIYKNGYDMNVAEFFKNMVGTKEMTDFMSDVTNKRMLTAIFDDYKKGNTVLDIAAETYRKYRKVEKIKTKLTDLDNKIVAQKGELPEMTNRLAMYLAGVDGGMGRNDFIPQMQAFAGVRAADGTFKDFNVVTNIPEWMRSEKIPRREYLIKSGAFEVAKKELDTATDNLIKAEENLKYANNEFDNKRMTGAQLAAAEQMYNNAKTNKDLALKNFETAETDYNLSIYGQYEDIKGRYQAVLGDKLFEYGLDDIFESTFGRERVDINQRFKDYADGKQTVLQRPISLPGVGVEPGKKIQSLFPDATIQATEYTEGGKKLGTETLKVEFWSKDKKTKFFTGYYERMGNHLVDKNILDYYYPGRENMPQMTLASMAIATILDTYQSNLLFRTSSFIMNKTDEAIKRLDEIYEDVVINKQNFMSEGEMAKVSSLSAIKKIWKEKAGLVEEPEAIDVAKLTAEQKKKLIDTVYNKERRDFAAIVEGLKTGKELTPDETAQFIDAYSQTTGGVDPKLRLRNVPKEIEKYIEQIKREIKDGKGNPALQKGKLIFANLIYAYQKALDVVYAVYGLPDIIGGVTGGKKMLNNYFKEQQKLKAESTNPDAVFITNMAELDKAFASIALTDKNAESLSKLGQGVRQYAKRHMDSTDPVNLAKSLKSFKSDNAIMNAIMSRTAFIFQSYPAMAMNAFINNTLIVLTGKDAWGRTAEAPERFYRAAAMVAANASAYSLYKNAGINLSNMTGMGIGGYTASFERKLEKEEEKKPTLERKSITWADALMQSIGFNNLDYFMNLTTSNLLGSSAQNLKQDLPGASADIAFNAFVPGAGLANEAAFWLNGKRVTLPKTIIKGKEGVDKSTAGKVDNIWDLIFYRFKTEEQKQQDRYDKPEGSSAGGRKSKMGTKRKQTRKSKRQ